jgi:DNA-binding CsgD family transcriptional regulator
MRISIDDFIGTLSGYTSTNDLLEGFKRVVAQFGFIEATYHVVSKSGRRVSATDGVRLATLPGASRALILAGEAIDFDPYFLLVSARFQPFHWFAGEEFAGPQHKEILRRLKELGFIDGIAVPVTSGPGDLAVFTLSKLNTRFDLNAFELRKIMAICHVTHDRFEEVLAAQSGRVSQQLSDREHEVMALVCDGASNLQAALRLKISTHTVDTILRRIFAKLGVKTRVEAALAYQTMRPKRLRDV